MKTALVTLIALVFLSSCTTTVKRLTLNGVEIGDDNFSCYYDMVEESVPTGDDADDGAQMYQRVIADSDVFQLFPTLEVARLTAEKPIRLTITHDMFKTIGQSITIDGKTTLLSDPVFKISSARLSPNGNRIAFSCRELPDSPWTIWLVGADGRNPRMLCRGRDADWLNQDTLVIATRLRKAHAIIKRKTDGRSETVLLKKKIPIRHVCVSSADGKVAFVTAFMDDGSDGNVWTYDPGSESLAQVSTHPARDDAPAWSADGRTLYFRSTRNGIWGIWFKSFGQRAATRLSKVEQ